VSYCIGSLAYGSFVAVLLQHCNGIATPLGKHGMPCSANGLCACQDQWHRLSYFSSQICQQAVRLTQFSAAWHMQAQLELGRRGHPSARPICRRCWVHQLRWPFYVSFLHTVPL